MYCIIRASIRASLSKGKGKKIEWEAEAQEKEILEDYTMASQPQAEQMTGKDSKSDAEVPASVRKMMVVESRKQKHIQSASSKKGNKLVSMLKTQTGARQAFIMSEVMKRAY